MLCSAPEPGSPASPGSPTIPHLDCWGGSPKLTCWGAGEPMKFRYRRIFPIAVIATRVTFCATFFATFFPAWCTAVSAAQASTVNRPAGGPLSDRIVAYQIEGRYDPKAHTLDATEVLTYTNKTGTRLDRFPFHLYLNAFQPKSTWMTEAQRSGQRDSPRGKPWDDKRFGSNEVKSLEILPPQPANHKLA